MTRESQSSDGLSRRRYLSLSNVAASTVVGGSALTGTGSVAAESSGPAETTDRSSDGTDAEHSATDVTLESHDGTEIAATVFRPAGASADAPVPMILHSHGWSGSRSTETRAFRTELDRGFGVLSFDQRGHGDSGGKRRVQNPEYEGRDVVTVLDHVTGLEWVARSRDADGEPVSDDPMVFAIGGSYGGAYQLVGAFTETRERGSTRFDALAPEITWFDLSESLAPQGVTRSVWMLLLYLVGGPKQPTYVHEATLWGLATGRWPDGSVEGVPDIDSKFFRNGPSGFVDDGIRLDIPVLFGQGLDDNLFNLNQGWHNLERSLTDDARKRSALVGYNGGHALPNVLPPGHSSSGNACSEVGFDERRLRFFEAVRDGGDACDVVDATYQLTTMDGDRCVHRNVLDEHESMSVEDAQCDVVEVDHLSDAGFNAVADLTADIDVQALVEEKGSELEARLDDDEIPVEDGFLGEIGRFVDDGSSDEDDSRGGGGSFGNEVRLNGDVRLESGDQSEDDSLFGDSNESANGGILDDDDGILGDGNRSDDDGILGDGNQSDDDGVFGDGNDSDDDQSEDDGSDDDDQSGDDGSEDGDRSEVGTLLPGGEDGTVLTTGVGVPTHLEITEGPLTVAGIPFVNATVTTGCGEQRIFAALSVGTSREDAVVVQNNMLPLREPEPVDGVEREIELPGVAVDVAADERLFLTLSAVSDMSILHGSRVPGTVTLEDITVDVPVVDEADDCECEGNDGDDGDDDSDGDDGSDGTGGDDDQGDGSDGTGGDDDNDDGTGRRGDNDGDNGGRDDHGGGDSGHDHDGTGGHDHNGADDADGSKRKGKRKGTGDGSTGSADGSKSDGSKGGNGTDESRTSNESGSIGGNRTGGDGDGGDGDDSDGSPGPGALGALGTLGGVGYLLSRRLEKATGRSDDS